MQPVSAPATRVLSAAAAALALVGAVPRTSPWYFPGTVAVYAQRSSDSAPFVSRDAHRAMPSASIIKLVILTGIVREIDRGALRWRSTLVIRAPEIVAGSERFGTAHAGQRATVKRLADAMIDQSDNTAGNVLADHLGFSGVNAVAISLQLHQTRMRRHFMDFAARARGIDNTTSAADIGALLLSIERGARGMPARAASARGCRTMVRIMLRQEDRDVIPAGIERSVPIASKTGVLPGVRDDVAIVDPFGPHPYVVALLSEFLQVRELGAYARLRSMARTVDELARR